MKIGINCQFCGTSTGIGQYTSYLVAGLSKCVSTQMKITLVVARNRHHAVYPSTVRVTRLPPAHRFVWANLYAPWVMYRERFDLYHALDNLSLPLFWPKGQTRYVLTVHDLLPLLFPESVKRQHSYYFRVAIRRLLKMADAIIVDSDHTRALIAERFETFVDKVTVVHLGVDTSRFRPMRDKESIHQVRERYGLGDDPYLLYVGNIEPRKNLSAVIYAYAEILRSGELNSEPRLVIAGANGGLCNDVLALPSRLGLSRQISFIGTVSDEELPPLYAGASVFLFPSLYEGFGLPVLEAMACGTPVITSNVTSLPEIAGDAAVVIDPVNTQELVNAMIRLLTNEALAKELQQKGFDRVMKFTWEDTVRRTLQIYERVYGLGHAQTN
jgi:glycosyltransferase involved in cell wall biosynthesis